MSHNYRGSSDSLEPLDLRDYDASFFDNQIMRVDELAGYLKVSSKTIYRMALKGEIPSKRVGKSYRFFLPDIIQWLKTGGNYGKRI